MIPHNSNKPPGYLARIFHEFTTEAQRTQSKESLMKGHGNWSNVGTECKFTQDNLLIYRSSVTLCALWCNIRVRETELFIAESVLLETEWVLRFAYGFSPPDVVSGMRKLLGLANVHVDDAGKMAEVLDWHEQGLDFADALHLASSDTLSALITFDSKFIQRAKGKSHCQVRKP